ncbi:autotransporter domain-containing protein [Bosea sp. 2KB_26]|uniref:autotransporter domain-containing protein n=1 Tax=Bosea sp. 2KB_26 TaxID=3237475 RepID=UPI003F939B8E
MTAARPNLAFEISRRPDLTPAASLRGYHGAALSQKRAALRSSTAIAGVLAGSVMLGAILIGASPAAAQSLGGGGAGGRHGVSKPVAGGAGAGSGLFAGGGGGGGGGRHGDRRSGTANGGQGGAGGSGAHAKGGGDGGGTGAIGFDGRNGSVMLPGGQAITGGAGGAGAIGGDGSDGQPFGGIWGHDSGSGGGGGGGGTGAILSDPNASFVTAPILGGSGGAGGKGGKAGTGAVGLVGPIPGAGYGGAGGGGGGGGGGGVGLVLLQSGEVLVRSVISGGNGGAGGAGGTGGDGAGGVLGQNCPQGLPCFLWGDDGGDGYYGGSGGNGGDGAVGLYASGSGPVIVQNQSAIRGGDGGAGGVGGTGGGGKNGGDGGHGGNAGNGGDGLVLAAGGRLQVQAGGLITGGKGGAGGAAGAAGYGSYNTDPGHYGTAGQSGRGGRAVAGGGGVRIVTAGQIEGGLNADGSHADAISLTGGGNTLELQPGYRILGNVALTRDDSNPNTLVLGGWQNASFDLATLGNASQAFGIFAKDGPGTWTVTGAASFANVSIRNGGLVLSGAAQLASTTAVIAPEAGSNAAVTISGSAAKWNNAVPMVIGDKGDGSLTITNGGTLTSLFTLFQPQLGIATIIGKEAGSRGTVLISGSGAHWSNYSALYLGIDGSGQMTIANGGSLDSYGETIIGGKPGAPGSDAVVTGAGSRWTVHRGPGYLERAELGVGSTSSLLISDDGRVQSDTAAVAGSLIVTGAGSVLTTVNSDALYHGVEAFTLSGLGGGAATATVSDGGLIDTGKYVIALKDYGPSSLNIGAGAGAPAAAPGFLKTGGVQISTAGALVFNHTASDYRFDAALSSAGAGAGTIRLLSGTTILTGDSSGFSGAVTVASSTLRMAGSARLGGAIAINAGGRVEGEGSLGAITIGNGGTLAPSGPTSLTVNGNLTANAGGTIRPSDAAPLIVNGTLTLNAGGNYDYQLRSADAPAIDSATTQVNGNLALNGGILNIGAGSQPMIGFHRVFTYTGTLSGGGLGIGSTPATSPFAYDYRIDISQAGKVDLLVQQNGLNILQLWGTTSAGGASGTWNAGSQNWFDYAGAAPTQWGSGYGVFRGPGGTVTVDGQQNLVGLQFAGGSYTLVDGAGGSLNLGGYSNGSFVITTPEIRVLDGETATVALTITGSDGLGKTGDGTLILSGANTYTGGTMIVGGTLQISDDRNLGGTGSLTFDNGALHTTADIVSARSIALNDTGAIDTDAGTTLRLTGGLSGAGGLIKWGAGTLALTGSNSWSGGTLITAGTLFADSAGALPGMTGYVLTGGKLDLNSYNLAMSLLAGTGGEIALGTATLTVDQSEDSTFAGGITGAGRIEKAGAGTLLLTGTSSYSGGTAIRGGTLAIIADANLGNASSNLALSGGGRLATLADITSSRAITLTGSGTIETMAGTTFALSGAISGTGSLVKDGWGSLALTGSASHGGGTTIAAGILQIGNGGTTGELAGNVVNNALLSFNRTNDYVFAGAISGSGSVVQSGGGTTILTGNNSYSGGTVIRAGVLEVASDGNLGAQGTAISFFGGALRFDTAFDTSRTVLLLGNGTVDTNGRDATLTGGVYGFGDLIKTGAGTLTLTGSNFYRRTVIAAGRLVGDAASISGDIVNNGTVVFDQRSDASIASVFSGTGRFDKTGRGGLELRGDSAAYSGTTTVSAGMLVVNGSLGGEIDVLSGARLQGSGTVGATTIRSGATIAPGNSIGTLTVAGDVAFERGAIYEVEVDAGGMASDLIRASGMARLGGGSVVHLGEDGNYRANQRYTILTADRGVLGRFDDVSSRYLFLDPSLGYDATSVTLTLLRNDLPFAALAQTRNQTQTSLGLESLDEASPLWQRFTQLRDADEGRRAFDSLSGEIHASAKTALIEGSQMVRSAVSDRIRAAFDGIGAPHIATLAYASGKGGISTAPAENLALWARGFGSWGQTQGDGNAASLTRSTNGLIAGLDLAATADSRAGIMAGYSRSHFEVARRRSQGDADNYTIGVYGGARFDRLRLTGAVNFTWHDLSMRRSVSFPGGGEQLLSGYGAHTLQAFGEIAYRLDFGPGVFEPFANLAYVNLRSDDFRETGGIAALSAGPQTTAVTFATLGLRAQTGVELGGSTVQLNGTLGWRHAGGDLTPLSLQAFAGGAPFSIAGVPIARDALVLGAGIGMKLTPAAELSIAYDGQLARSATDHSFNARVGIRF